MKAELIYIKQQAEPLYGYIIQCSTVEEIAKIVQTWNFISCFDKQTGLPVIFSHKRLDDASVEITAKNRYILHGTEF